MKIHFHLTDSMTDCQLELFGGNGRKYFIAAPTEKQNDSVSLEIPGNNGVCCSIPSRWAGSNT